MKFATYVMAFNQDKWIMRNIENSYPHVDRIYVMYSKFPFGYNVDDKDTIVNDFDINIIRSSKYMDKIVIIEGYWNSDTEERNFCLRRAKADGFDYLMVHDADEFYFHKDFEKLIETVRNNPDVDVFEMRNYTFWKSFKYVLCNPEKGRKEAIGQSIVNLHTVNKYDYIRDVHSGKHLLVPNVMIYHGAYVRTDEEMYKKIKTWAHSSDFDTDKWYNEVWLKWTLESKNLHPIWPEVWSHCEVFNEPLPEIIQDFNDDLYLFTWIGMGDVLIYYGLIKELSKKYNTIYYYVWENNYNNCVRLFKSISNVKLLKIVVVNNYAQVQPSTLVLGWQYYEEALKNNPDLHGDQFCYDSINMPLSLKWDNFYLERDLQKEKNVFYNILELKDNEEFFFVHEDADKGFIDRKYLKEGVKIVNPTKYPQVSLFDFLYTIEKAKEVHVVNSSFRTLIDLMNIKYDNLYYHRYVKSQYLRDVEHSQVACRLNWKVLN